MTPTFERKEGQMFEEQLRLPIRGKSGYIISLVFKLNIIRKIFLFGWIR